MSKYDEPLILFNPKLPKLSKSEKAVLKLLVEAGKLIVPVYKLQENPEYPGANFYPHDATKEEIKKAAKKDPEILSPYTVVERENGKLIAVPYHVKYADLLRPIAEKLEQAANITENKEFGRFLHVQAKALVEGNYDKLMIISLQMKPCIIDVSIGPIEYVDDHMFFTKTSYQAWVGVMEKPGTERLNNYKSIILSARRKTLTAAQRVDNYDNVKAKVIDVVLFSGLMARAKLVGTCLPFNIDIVEKYGSEITLFNQSNDLRMKDEVLPVFNKIFSKEFRDGFNFEDLRRASLRYIAMHELAHSFLYYRHAEEKLEEMFNSIYELAATVLGFRVAGSLLLIDRIDNKQLESMIITVLCRSYYLSRQIPLNRSVMDHVVGGTILINFLLESGALKKLNGGVIPNFMKIFISLQELYSILENLLSTGNYKAANKFVRAYTSKI